MSERGEGQPGEWVRLDLYGGAMALRESFDGSGEPLPPEECAAIRRVLEERVGPGWRPPLWPGRARADEALREFVRAVLDETASTVAPPDRLAAVIRWSDEDETFIATCPQLPIVSARGPTRVAALAELELVTSAALVAVREGAASAVV